MAASALASPSRRALLRGRRDGDPPQRPPWARPDDGFLSSCTRCDACIDACPESILSRGDGGFPVVDFKRGECTFCRGCVDACAPRALVDEGHAPWSIHARVETACLAINAVHCQACRDACPTGAVGFPLRPGVPRPVVDATLCTGCGACVAPCPVDAIRLRPDRPEVHA